ncbi:MAG: cobU [Gemmatimonadetes bacterium]|jgi:adenosylcobinamide kinase/adenosylcobinamide-phosphate guanylyltransferase|nr:cobU [Gemmatimonadota bacterium]
MTLTLLLGGVRSGKSARAVSMADALAVNHNQRVLFVATAGLYDDDMRARAARHRAERPTGWTTLEETLDVPNALRARAGAYDVIVLDCLTLWVSNVLLSSDPPPDEGDIAARTEHLVAALSDEGVHCIVVSNEVGLGIVPPTPLGRVYRDALGRANQVVAAAADRVVLMVAGLELPLKGAR